MDEITLGQSTTIFWSSFLAWWQPNDQLGDPSASLLLSSEKAVFCKKTKPLPDKETNEQRADKEIWS